MKRPFDAQRSEVLETDRNRTVALTEGRVQIHPQAGDSRQFDRVRGAGCKHSQALLRSRYLSSQELAFGPVQCQGEGEPMPALPRRGLQQCCASDEIVER